MTIPLKLNQARAIFLGELAELAPDVHEKLYSEVFPIYTATLKNRHAVIRLQDRLEVVSVHGLPGGAVSKLLEYAELPPAESGIDNQMKALAAFQAREKANAKQKPESPGPIPCDHLTDAEIETLQAALRAWGDKFRVKDAWLFQAALDALELAHTTGVKDLISKGLQRPSFLRARNDANHPEPFVVPYGLDGMLPKPEDVFKRYSKFYEETQGREKAQFKQHVRWVIQRHFSGWAYTKIAHEHEDPSDEYKNLTDSGVKKAVKRTAKEIGFTL